MKWRPAEQVPEPDREVIFRESGRPAIDGFGFWIVKENQGWSRESRAEWVYVDEMRAAIAELPEPRPNVKMAVNLYIYTGLPSPGGTAQQSTVVAHNLKSAVDILHAAGIEVTAIKLDLVNAERR